MFESVPYGVIVPVAILMALMPLGRESHLVEKLRMLFAGNLKRPIGIFDLFLHSAPTIIALVKFFTAKH